MKCTHCASDVLPDGKFCGTCGAAVAAEPCRENHHWVSAGRGKGMKCTNCEFSHFVASTTTSNRQTSSFNFSQSPSITARATTNRETTLEDVVRATNRTTHAVRAFVLFLFYQLTALTIAYMVYSLAEIVGNSDENCPYEARTLNLCSPNSFLLFLAGVIWITGIVLSSRVGWSEIQKSDMTDSYRL